MGCWCWKLESDSGSYVRWEKGDSRVPPKGKISYPSKASVANENSISFKPQATAANQTFLLTSRVYLPSPGPA